MSNIIPRQKLDAIEKLIARGDLSSMDQGQKLDYMRSMCKLLGISMLGQPFDFIKFQGKEQMFANAKCAAQLRAVYKISIKIVSRERIDGLYCVTAQGVTGKGRTDESIGAINIKGLAGEALANALMKGETKAKRRVTLSLCGLGMLDSDTAKEVAEIEAKAATERAVEDTGEKLEQTMGVPEFETEKTASDLPPAEAAPTDTDYKLRSVKGQIGKTCKQVPLKKLTTWLKFFDETKKEGKPMHPNVEMDAFEITQFLERAKIAQPTEPQNG